MICERIKKREYVFLCIGLIVTICAIIFSIRNSRQTNPISVHQQLQQKFLEKERHLTACMDSILQQKITLIPSLLDFCKNNKCSEGEYVFYVYQDNRLCAWSSNMVSLPGQWDKRMLRFSGFLQWERKSLYACQDSLGSIKVLGMYLLQTNGAMAAQYTHLDLFDNQPSDINVIPFEEANTNNIIYNLNNESVFALDMRSHIRVSDESASLEMMLWMLAVTFLLVFFFKMLQKKEWLRQLPNRQVIIFVTMVSLLMLPFFSERLFPAMYASNLFSSVYYAFGFHSLGELFLGTYFMLLISIILYKYRTLQQQKRRNGGNLFFHLFLLNIIYLIVFFFLYHMIRNASVSVYPSLPLRAIGGENLILLKIIFSISLVNILCALHLIFDRYYHESRRIATTKKQWLYAVVVALVIAWIIGLVLIAMMNDKDLWLYVIGSLVYISFVIITCIHVNKAEKRFSARYYVSACLLSTLLLSMLFENVNVKRLANSKESFANSLLENEEPLLRYNLNEFGDQILKDENMTALLRDSSTLHEDVVNYLQNQYVQPYFEKNRNKLYVGHTRVSSDLIRIRQYQLLFENSEKDTLFPNLCVIGKSMGEKRYLMMKTIPTGNSFDDSVCVALEIISNADYFMPNFLLSRREHRLEKEMLMFSCAEYDNDLLAYSRDSRGIFRQHLSDFSLDTLYNGKNFSENGYEYVLYYKNPDKVILLASPRKPLGNIVSLFAYLFIALGIFSILLSLIINFQSHNTLMFRHRIQVYVVTIILLMSLVSMLLFSLFAHSFSKTELNQNAMSRINLIARLLPTNNLSKDSSNLFYLDQHLVTALYNLPKEYVENVNIYTLNGEGIVHMARNLPILQSPDRLNPKVMDAFAYQHKNFYIDDAFMKNSIDAAILYQTLCNQSGEVVAYLGFPTRQRGRYAEYLFSSIIPVFLGIYLILTILFAFFSSLFSNYIVSSLTKIAQLLSKVKLKSKNQKIVWKYEDEIGLLVKDYNRLVDDLEVSAEMLARTSKESAWKELAQQVAHEIKNPLTPMKLRTQQLQKKMQAGKLTEEEMDNYTKMMIGQIDALTEITTSFSSLAKIHQTNGRKENLVEIIQCALETFENSSDFVYIFEHDPMLRQAIVWSDRQQLLRVFNNLIKNAIQAKKPHVQQRIVLNISDYDEEKWKIMVTDFGCGMDEEAQKKAFIPHFTTKSSGSGLGLAIVKNIVSDWGGEITFQSIKNEYTIFTILFPKYKDADMEK